MCIGGLQGGRPSDLSPDRPPQTPLGPATPARSPTCPQPTSTALPRPPAPGALTVTCEAIPHPAWLAPAAETPRDVEAGSVTVTAVSPKLTLVHICEERNPVAGGSGPGEGRRTQHPHKARAS